MTENNGTQDMTTHDPATPASSPAGAPAPTTPETTTGKPAWRTKGTRQHRTTLIGATAAIVLAVGGVGAAVADEMLDDDDEVTGSSLEQAREAALDEVGDGTVTDVDHEDGEYEVEVRREDGSEVDVHLDESFGTLWVDGRGNGAAASGDDADDRDDDGDRDDSDSDRGRDEADDRDRDSDRDDADDQGRSDAVDDDAPLTADERDSASAAALAESGEGDVTDVDREREGFEVEVRLVDGSEVDVYLDEAFAVVAVEPDDAS